MRHAVRGRAWDRFLDLTLRFWELDYKAAALRMVSNGQVPPHAVEKAVREIWGKTGRVGSVLRLDAAVLGAGLQGGRSENDFEGPVAAACC
jgi:hypothetical protein